MKKKKGILLIILLAVGCIVAISVVAYIKKPTATDFEERSYTYEGMEFGTSNNVSVGVENYVPTEK